MFKALKKVYYEDTGMNLPIYGVVWILVLIYLSQWQSWRTMPLQKRIWREDLNYNLKNSTDYAMKISMTKKDLSLPKRLVRTKSHYLLLLPWIQWTMSSSRESLESHLRLCMQREEIKRLVYKILWS